MEKLTFYHQKDMINFRYVEVRVLIQKSKTKNFNNLYFMIGTSNYQICGQN